MRLAGVMAVVLVFASACTSTVPATVTWEPAAKINEERTVFLTANRQRSRIERSLRDAGLTVSSSAGEAAYSLRVDVGSSRGSTPCGTKNNVRYILSQVSKRALVIKARGYTGSCTPNVFDDMSRLLESHFGT